jgi:hypothetical protein
MSGVNEYNYAEARRQARIREAIRLEEERRIREAIEAQRRKLQQQLNTINLELSYPIQGLNSEIQSVEMDKQRQLNRVYQQLGQSLLNVESNLTSELKNMEQSVQEIFQQYSKDAVKAIEQFKTNLEHKEKNQTKTAHEVIQQTKVLVDNLSTLKSFDQERLISQVEQGLHSAVALVNSAPQAAIASGLLVHQKTIQIKSVLEQKRLEDLRFRHVIDERIGKLEARIISSENLQYEMPIGDQVLVQNADINQWTNKGLATIKEEVRRLKVTVENQNINGLENLNIQEMLSSLEQRLDNTIEEGKDSLSNDINCRIHVDTFKHDLVNLGWTYSESSIELPLNYQLDFVNANGHVLVINVKPNSITTEMHSSIEGENLSNVHKLIDEQTIDKFIGETMKGKPNFKVKSSVCITPPREVRERLERVKKNGKTQFKS